MAEEFFVPLVERREVTESTMSFWFDATGAFASFIAGQYATFTLPSFAEQNLGGQASGADPWDGKHDFSLASAPHELPRLMITTRMRDTAFKRNLKNMPIGTRVKVFAPMGSFVLHKNAERPALFIAGGIGITPIHSIVLDALQKNLPHELYLLHSNRTPVSAPFLAEFESLAKQHNNFHFIPTMTDLPSQISPGETWEGERGRIDAAMIRRHLPFLLNPEPSTLTPICYIVGPPAMVSAMLPIVEQAGVDPDNVRTEEFAGY